MSKQKRPDTYDAEVSEIPKHLSKRKKEPKKKKVAPKEYVCPFCETSFRIKSEYVYYWGSEHPSNFKCKNCGAGPWGYMRDEEVTLPRWFYGRKAWAKLGDTQKVWTPEYCTFCDESAHSFVRSSEHYFMLWTTPEDDVYCCKCKFRGKVGGKRK